MESAQRSSSSTSSPHVAGREILAVQPHAFIFHPAAMWTPNGSLLPVQWADLATKNRPPHISGVRRAVRDVVAEIVAETSPFNSRRIIPVRLDGGVMVVGDGFYSDVIATRSELRVAQTRANRLRLFTNNEPPVSADGHFGFGMVLVVEYPGASGQVVQEMVFKRRLGDNDSGSLGASVDEGIEVDDVVQRNGGFYLDIAAIAARGLAEEMAIVANSDVSRLNLADGTTVNADFSLTGVATCVDTGGFDIGGKVVIRVEDAIAANRVKAAIDRGMKSSHERQTREAQDDPRQMVEHNGRAYWFAHEPAAFAALLTRHMSFKSIEQAGRELRAGTSPYPLLNAPDPGITSYAAATVVLSLLGHELVGNERPGFRNFRTLLGAAKSHQLGATREQMRRTFSPHGSDVAIARALPAPALPAPA